MAGKTANWKPGPTVCRCCLAEGCYKDISTEYFWMGKREVYAEMLTNTFNVSIAFSQSGGPNSNSRLICEPCISRLRDASNFKRQVLDCEKTFMQHLDPGSSLSHQDLPEELAGLDDAVKVERVKIERDAPSDDDFDATPDFLDDDDDELDQPLTNFATKEPKKEAVSLLEELLDNPAVTIKKKSVVKTKQPPAKKVKRTETAKPTSSKVVAKTATAEKKKKEQNPMSIARRNAYLIVENTTAYPFRNPESAIMCVFCFQSFGEADQFRIHMEAEHKEFKTKHAFYHVGETYLKVDVTDLRCRTCNESFFRLADMVVHLVMDHDQDIDLKYDIGVFPFRMESGGLSCGNCEFKESNLRALSRHIQKHYLQCICENCGKAYATNTSLMHHVRFSCSANAAQRRCRKCRKVVDSFEAHLKESELCRQHICNICGERFGYWKQKQNHMELAHSIPKKTYRCPECVLVFPTASKLRHHFMIVHTEDYMECPYCGQKFDVKNRFERHLIIHTGEKSFVCDVCSKAFNRKSSLTQHMWIHSDVKKYVCKVCEKTFNQKVCWKSHMKSQHPDHYVDV